MISDHAMLRVVHSDAACDRLYAKYQPASEGQALFNLLVQTKRLVVREQSDYYEVMVAPVPVPT
jgi:hypothetical protein